MDNDDIKLNFIKNEEPDLRKEDDDLLGTKPYVETLLDIIEDIVDDKEEGRNKKIGYTIGLFGGWGTGKSLIIKKIKEKYDEEKNNEIPKIEIEKKQDENDSLKKNKFPRKETKDENDSLKKNKFPRKETKKETKNEKKFVNVLRFYFFILILSFPLFFSNNFEYVISNARGIVAFTIELFVQLLSVCSIFYSTNNNFIHVVVIVFLYPIAALFIAACIIKFLIQPIISKKSKSSKVEVFIYDAWKYSKNSFKRTFILEFKKRFRLKENESDQNFYNDKHEDIAHKNELDNKKVFLGIIFFLLPVIYVIEMWKIANADMDSQTVIDVVLALIIYFTGSIYVQCKISITKPKTFASEQFEIEFKETIRKITKPTLTEKAVNLFNWHNPFKKEDKEIYADNIVIVIDNIDRCHIDLAFELLLTAKSFLEQKSVIFIIPIDKTKLEEYIEKEKYDENKFFKKIFDTTLSIKKFSEDNLFNFAKERGKELPDKTIKLIQVIIKNPGEINHFLSILQAEIKLVRKQEENKSNSEKRAITEIIKSLDIESIAEILLVREECPEIYKELENDPSSWKSVEKQVIKNNNKVVYFKKDKGEENKKIFLTEKQKIFFRLAENISVSKIESFSSNKDFLINKISNMVLGQEWETVKYDYLKKDRLTLEELIKILDKEPSIVKDKSKANIFSFILKIVRDDKYGEEFSKNFDSDEALIKEFIKNIEADINCEKNKNIVIIINKYNSSKTLSTELLEQYVEKIIEFLNDGNNLEYLLFWFEQLNPLIINVKSKDLKNNILNTLNQKNMFLWEQYSAWREMEEYQKVLKLFLEITKKSYILSEDSDLGIKVEFNKLFKEIE